MNRPGFFGRRQVYLVAAALMVSPLQGCAGQDTGGAISGSTVEPPIAAVRNVPDYSDDRFLSLVGKYATADGESVDYAAWQGSTEDMAALDEQVALIAAISPTSHPELFPTNNDERRYWINTYNTLVLDAVLDYWPLDSVKDVKLSLTSRLIPGKGFFHDREVVVGGERTNLLKLEKEVLRAQDDPRLHFALNCASGSCPVLRPSDWSDEELDQAARDFINNPANVSVEGQTVYLSKIFDWFKSEFPRDIYNYLKAYAEDELNAQLDDAIQNDYPTKYHDYDWSLNEINENDSPDGDADDGD